LKKPFSGGRANPPKQSRATLPPSKATDGLQDGVCHADVSASRDWFECDRPGRGAVVCAAARRPLAATLGSAIAPLRDDRGTSMHKQRMHNQSMHNQATPLDRWDAALIGLVVVGVLVLVGSSLTLVFM
jgi:hypothetical protein